MKIFPIVKTSRKKVEKTFTKTQTSSKRLQNAQGGEYSKKTKWNPDCESEYVEVEIAATAMMKTLFSAPSARIQVIGDLEIGCQFHMFIPDAYWATLLVIKKIKNENIPLVTILRT